MRLPQSDWRGMMKEEMAEKEKNGVDWERSLSSLVATMEFSGTWWMTFGPLQKTDEQVAQCFQPRRFVPS